MKRFDKIRLSVARALTKGLLRSGSNAGGPSRLFSSWTTTPFSSNKVARDQGAVLVARSRDLELNNPYAKQFIRLLTVNVVGPRGIRLKADAKEGANDPAKTGNRDKAANDAIERAWAQWGRVGTCTMDGESSWRDVEKLCVKTVGRDGEIFVRMVTGREAGNKFMFAVQLIETDLLDWNYRDPSRNIDMGIESDAWGRPIAYWFWTAHPNDDYAYVRRERVRIPAEQIIHLKAPERAGQKRGTPWMVSGMDKMKMIDGYMEAEIVAARAGAAKMGFYISKDGAAADPDDYTDDGAIIQDFEPATISQAPEGFDFKGFDPQHPTTAFDSFLTANLRAMASAFGVTYPSLANDLKGVNYSSIRHGALEERDGWRDVQRWLIEHLHERIFERWLIASLSFGGLNLPLAKIEKFMDVKWFPRGWAWVDPVKDATANRIMREEGIKSRSTAARELGFEWEDETDQIVFENDKLNENGIVIENQLPNEGDDNDENNQDN